MYRCSDGTNYQSQCKFNCNLGYDLIGESVRTCLASGIWTGAEVACESKFATHWKNFQILR